MSGNTQLFTNIFDLGPPASSAKSNFQLPLQCSYLTQCAASLIIKEILISVETAAATLVKRCGYLTKCVAGLIIKEILISVETVATTLVKRYGYLTQCAAGLIIKEIFNFS